jgi:hypothetical protein
MNTLGHTRITQILLPYIDMSEYTKKVQIGLEKVQIGLEGVLQPVIFPLHCWGAWFRVC